MFGAKIYPSQENSTQPLFVIVETVEGMANKLPYDLQTNGKINPPKKSKFCISIFFNFLYVPNVA